MIGPGGLFKTIFNALRTTTIQEEQFILGNTFSYEDYMTYDASENGAGVKIQTDLTWFEA